MRKKLRRYGVYGKVTNTGVEVYVSEYRFRFQAIRHGWELMNSGDWCSVVVEDMDNGKAVWSATT
jgi:hypothetical protein